ncbi:TetR/AcrR family transcriptional regulator C-terminal ligand-binding domain-containing protein [Kibdelosporangium persicum]|uniref:TetR/AcrR family transcriptional regulator C-terminal ligand-binding domain-containing protein n=1 Tax=Kibdelosporangium persicum TaxID=2698649 RepID=UPI0028AF20A3|nr:TetR/AcrR family transcriptional regulator C-terminal ligand-binding domain-containing protein [Kibdelosporangium persicum]
MIVARRNAFAPKDSTTHQTDLRDDLIQYLTALSNSLAGFFAIAAAASFSGLLTATGLSPAEIREQAMGDQLLPQTRTIYRQAAARGEIILEGIPPAVLALPFDLVRHDLLIPQTPQRRTHPLDRR